MYENDSNEEMESTLSKESNFELQQEDLEHHHSFESVSENSDCSMGNTCKQKTISILMKIKAMGGHSHSGKNSINP